MAIMHNGFTLMITALWQEIGLGDPSWSDQGAALLHLEDRTVELTLSEDGGYVLASLDIAPLAEDYGRRRAQIDALLRLSLLSLTANRGVIRVVERGGATIAVVQGLCRCEIGLIHRLSEVVVDLVSLRDECLQVLAFDNQSRTPSSHGPVITAAEGSLIFTP